MGNTRFPKMISLGLRVDKSKKIKICCQDMKEEDYCLLISKNKRFTPTTMNAVTWTFLRQSNIQSFHRS
ncbi:MAG: hypothetical protein WAK17_11810 [Candidatus Nitrosopolaris sp.]